jgi:hypothetical protein
MISVADLRTLGLGLEPDPELETLRAVTRARAGLGAPGIPSLVGSVVRRATFRSNFTPPVTWDPSEPSSPSSSSGTDMGAVGRTIQPALDVELHSGQVVTLAPAGDPTGDYRTGIAIVAGVVIGVPVVSFGIGYLIGRRRRR